MRLVELSNHPADMRRAADAAREAQFAQAQREYEALLATHEQRVRELRDERERARTERRWFRWFGRALADWRQQARSPRPPLPASTYPRSADEVKLDAGIEGEQLVAEELGSMLDDEWILFRGYKNRAGEIDHLLLGPQALIAIEVKHRNARASCSGDEWWFEKFDRYGNQVGQGSLADRAGRSPSEQLNEPADELERFIGSRGQPADVVRTVLFTHKRSAFGTLDGLTVDLVARSASAVLEYFIGGREATLGEQQRAELARLIERDHRHHEERRRRR
jgi:Nuclease-related domain